MPPATGPRPHRPVHVLVPLLLPSRRPASSPSAVPLTSEKHFSRLLQSPPAACPKACTCPPAKFPLPLAELPFLPSGLLALCLNGKNKTKQKPGGKISRKNRRPGSFLMPMSGQEPPCSLFPVPWSACPPTTALTLPRDRGSRGACPLSSPPPASGLNSRFYFFL